MRSRSIIAIGIWIDRLSKALFSSFKSAVELTFHDNYRTLSRRKNDCGGPNSIIHLAFPGRVVLFKFEENPRWWRAPMIQGNSGQWSTIPNLRNCWSALLNKQNTWANRVDNNSTAGRKISTPADDWRSNCAQAIISGLLMGILICLLLLKLGKFLHQSMVH